MYTGKTGINNNIIQAENQVLADQEHLKNCSYYALFEQATDAIMVTDLNGNLINVNSSVCAMTGYTKQELLGKNVNDFIEPENLKETPIPYDELIQGKNTITQRKVLHKNGSIVYLESNAKKCGENQIWIIARNITERTQEQSILQKSEANLQTIFNNTDTIYVFLDKKLKIISANSRAREFAAKELGHNIEISKYFLDYFEPKKRSALLINMEAALNGNHIQYEVSYPQPDAASNWYSVRLFPISNGGNKVYGVIMAVTDITEKIRLERKLQEERIKKQQEITDAVITAEENERQQIGLELHDNVNQLLATSRLYIGMVKQRLGKKDYQLISDADSFITSAINEIRNLSHSFISPFIDEYKLIQALDHLTASVSKSSTLNILKVIEVDETTLGDKLKLAIYRVVQEQLNNAIKHAKATTIIISLVQENDKIGLTVKDDGVGFDTSKSPKGIGFMNIRTRAALFKGKLELISSPGNGCTMKVIFQRK